MLFYEKQLFEKDVVVSFSCDICGKSGEDEENFLHIKKTFGYESVCFSDMDHLSIDICEACLSLLYMCITPYYANTQEVYSP